MKFFGMAKYYLRKYLFYIVLALCLAALGLGIAFACLASKKSSQGAEIVNPSGDEKGNDEKDDPVSKTIIFCLPVENGSVSKDYCVDKLVYSSTLTRYATHSGIDFTGKSGASVLAVYDGKIESVETGLLDGTVITIDHGNGLKSVYKSVLDGESVTVGKTVKKGDKIGVISTSCRQEYKDGEHVHLEVYENGKSVNPMKYILTEEK